jgi:hypothetical protein
VVERDAKLLDAADVQFIKARSPLSSGDNPCKKWGCNEKEAWDFYIKYLGLDPATLGDVSGFFTNQFIDDVNNQDLNAVVEQAKAFKLPGR